MSETKHEDFSHSVFGLLYSSLWLYFQRFGRYVLRTHSIVVIDVGSQKPLTRQLSLQVQS